MTRLITIALLLIFASCAQPSAPQTEVKPFISIAESQASVEPYEISIEIGQAEDQAPILEIDMKLFQGSHFISPFSRESFSGKFGVHLDENPHLKLDSSFVETPRSVEEFDSHPFTNKLVNWVRVDTRYAYGLQVASKEDFEVEGLVSFTIEPRCTFEKNRFVIAQKEGELRVKKI